MKLKSLKSHLFRKHVGVLAVSTVCLLVDCVFSISAQPATPGDDEHEKEFNLHTFPPFLACIANPNDKLTLKLDHFKPGLAFDLFTVERSKLFSNGTVDPATNFTFGLAWYQS